MVKLPSLMLLLIIGVVSCAPVGTDPKSSGTRSVGPEAAPSRTLVLIGRQEPNQLSATRLLATGIGVAGVLRPFNAALAMLNPDAQALPELADELPKLNTDTWRVFPDGRMETTYRLRPNLTWHDGAPLTPADFMFAWQVYTTPDFGTANSPPHRLVDDVIEVDGRTLVIRWRGPFPGAGALVGLGGAGSSPAFAPLPRHLLQDAHKQGDALAFVQHPFWTVEYVGAGPYKLDRWEPGSFIEGVAFDGHALGKPRISRIRIIFNSDANAALAQLLSQEAHMTLDDSIGIDHAVTLKRDWDARGGGTVLYPGAQGRYIRVQLRPEYARPQALLDPAVRKALAHTIDKQAMNESIFYGAALLTDTMVPPSTQRRLRLETDIPTYPHDVRRAEQLMDAAGYTKDRDGFYVGLAEGRLNFEVKNIAQPRNDAERAILANGWRQFGFEVEEAAYRPSDARDGQALSTFRSLGPTGGIASDDRLLAFITTNIGSAGNNWVGNNTTGWSNAQFDRLMDLWIATLDDTARAQQFAQAARILNEELAAIPLYYAPQAFAFASSVRGVDATATEYIDWNMHQWELTN